MQKKKKKNIFHSNAFIFGRFCTFIVYLYDYAVTITVLNLFTKILTVFFQIPIFGVVEI